MDAVRGVVLELLADKEAVRKAEVMAAAAEGRIPVSDTVY